MEVPLEIGDIFITFYWGVEGFLYSCSYLSWKNSAKISKKQRSKYLRTRNNGLSGNWTVRVGFWIRGGPSLLLFPPSRSAVCWYWKPFSKLDFRWQKNLQYHLHCPCRKTFPASAQPPTGWSAKSWLVKKSKFRLKNQACNSIVHVLYLLVVSMNAVVVLKPYKTPCLLKTFRDSSALIDFTSCADTSDIFFDWVFPGLLLPLSRKSFILSLNESAAPS